MDLLVRICTFLLLFGKSEVEVFSKSEKDERNLNRGEDKHNGGFDVNPERERDENGGDWSEQGRVNGQSLLDDESDPSRESDVLVTRRTVGSKDGSVKSTRTVRRRLLNSFSISTNMD